MLYISLPHVKRRVCRGPFRSRWIEVIVTALRSALREQIPLSPRCLDSKTIESDTPSMMFIQGLRRTPLHPSSGLEELQETSPAVGWVMFGSRSVRKSGDRGEKQPSRMAEKNCHLAPYKRPTRHLLMNFFKPEDPFYALAPHSLVSLQASIW